MEYVYPRGEYPHRAEGRTLRARRSITFEKGGEFAHRHRLKQRLGMKTYFCDPYAAWQRGGGIENAGGVPRLDLPRKARRGHYA